MKTFSYPVLLSLEFKPIEIYLINEAWLQGINLEFTQRDLHANLVPRHSVKFAIGKLVFVLSKVKYKSEWLFQLSKVCNLTY